MAARYARLGCWLALAACTGGDDPTSDGVHSQAYGAGVLFSSLMVLMLVLTGAAIAYRVVKRKSRKP